MKQVYLPIVPQKQKLSLRSLFVATVALLSAASFNPLQAQVVHSSTVATSVWNVAGNWTGGLVPAPTDYVQFTTTKPTTGVNVDFNGTLNNGTLNQAVGGIELPSTRTNNLLINATNTTGTLTLNGTTINATSNVILRNASAKNLVIGTTTAPFLNLSLGNATNSVISTDGAGKIQVVSAISGTSTITSMGVGAGVITISGKNTHTGGVAILGAETEYTSDTAFGAIPGSFSPSHITIDGGRLTLNSPNAPYTINANRGIQVSGSSANGISAKTQTFYTYNGIISDKAGATGTWAKQGGTLLILGGVSTYSGATSINNGTVQLSAGNNRLPLTTTIYMGQLASTNIGTFDLGGFSQEVTGLNSNSGTALATVTANNNITTSTGASTLTLSGAGTYTYGDGTGTNSGVITGAVSLVKSGTGIQILGDSNSYSGTTTITAGELRFTYAPSNPSYKLNGNMILNGGTLSTAGTTGTGMGFGMLALNDNSFITLNSSVHTIKFTASAAQSWTSGKTLTISGWEGTVDGSSSGTKGKIMVGTDNTALTAAQLSQIVFVIGGTNYSAKLTGSGELIPVCNQPVITAIGSNGPICAGNNLNLSVTATGLATLTYSWTGANSFASTTQNPTITAATVAANGNYTLRVTNGCGAFKDSTIAVVVNATGGPSVSVSANPGSTICSGTNVTFTATPTNGGTSPAYQWTLNGTNVATGATYSNNALNNGDIVVCTLTSNAACLSTNTASSTPITINVTTSVVPSVSIVANTTTTICAGSSVTFTPTPVNGGATPAYQWVLNGTTVSTNATYTNSTLATGDSVYCVLSSSNGCASPTTATSNSLKFTVNALVTPSVSVNTNTGNAVCTGTKVIFTATPVNGGTPTYSWTKNGNAVGTNSNTYTDSTLLNNDVVVCRMVSTANCRNTDTVYAAPYAVTVNALPTPTITGTPVICNSGSTTLDAGAGYASYLWSNGETTQIISAITATSYSVTVSNGTCSGTSAPVAVTQKNTPAQPAGFTTSALTVNQGATANNYTYIVPFVSGVTYNWSYTGNGATITGTSDTVTVLYSLTATAGNIAVTASNTCGTSAPRTVSVAVNGPLPAIKITEYMYGGNGGEYVEITNTGSTAVSMTGWSFDDNSRLPGSQNISAIGTLQAGESAIITESSVSDFRTNWNLCTGAKIIGGNTNNLGRDDEINIYDSTGTLIDRLTYGDDVFAPGTVKASGKSARVSPAGLGYNKISQWSLSVINDIDSAYTSVAGDIGSPTRSNYATVAYNPCFVQLAAPVIAINVATTNNFLDGGMATSPLSPYGLSGTLNDATDPASIYGVDFTVSDPMVPIANLTVTVNSSNTTVVPLSNVVLTGTGANRNVKIIPAAVGYSTITVTVNNGTYSSDYLINYAVSDGSPSVIPANTVWHTGMSDASTGIPLDNKYFVTGDDELNILNVYPIDQSGLPNVVYNYGSLLNLPQGSGTEVDVEASAKSGAITGRMYWSGSMSNGKLPYDNKPNRDRLFATSLSGTGDSTQISLVGYYNLRTALLAWGDTNGYGFTASAAAGVNSKGNAGFSLEGMCFGPDGTTLYLGLRAPLVPTTFRHKALIAPIVNFEAWFNNGSPAGPPNFAAPIELDLDFRGIRELTRLSNGTIIIVGGSPIEDGGTNNIYKWTGYAGDAPVNIPSGAGDILNIEGAMQVNDAAGNIDLTKLQLITDGGAQILYQDNSAAKDFGDHNLRKFRNDRIDNINLDICQGFVSTISSATSTTVCYGDSVTLTAPAGVHNTYAWSTGDTTQSITVGTFKNYTVTVTSTTSHCTSSSAQKLVNALGSDFNHDNVTDNIDFLQLLGLYNQNCTTCFQDLNGDNVVNNVDFLILLGQFNHHCH